MNRRHSRKVFDRSMPGAAPRWVLPIVTVWVVAIILLAYFAVVKP